MAKHGDLTSIHKFAYYEDSDPAVLYPGEPQSGDAWVDSSSGPPFQLSVRNVANDDWEEVGSVGVGFANPMDSAGDLIRGGVAGVATKLDAGTLAQFLVMRGGTPIPTWEDVYGTVQMVVDGSGSVIATGIKAYIEVPFAALITEVTLLADQSGSIQFDLWKDTYANFPPVVGDSITAAAKPTITTALKSKDSTLTGWNKVIAAGDIIAVNVDSCTDIERCTIALKIKRT